VQNLIEKQQFIFNNTVLLTSANMDYLDILQNWQYLARTHNLSFAVLAMDDTLYEFLGDDASVPSDTVSVSGEMHFRQEGFNTLTCNKLRQVLKVLESCQVNVVFSDCDNIFLRDPFRGTELGKLIQSGQFDYIYQSNDPVYSNKKRQRSRNSIPEQANTGFYYQSHANAFFKQVIRDTLVACSIADKHEKYRDDQTLFWKSLHNRNKKGGGVQRRGGIIWWNAQRLRYLFGAGPVRHCQPAQVHAIVESRWKPDAKTRRPVGRSDDEVTVTGATMCGMDGWYHPIGEPAIPSNPDPVTYHANFAVGKKAKIEKLKTCRSDGYGWDPSRIVVP
jgi:hypothetical protein